MQRPQRPIDGEKANKKKARYYNAASADILLRNTQPNLTKEKTNLDKGRAQHCHVRTNFTIYAYIEVRKILGGGFPQDKMLRDPG